MIILTLLCVITPFITAETIYDVTKYGANNKGNTECTAAIRKTIETAASRGGGTVYIPPGKYLTGPIQLKSNIHVQFADNVLITFSANKNEYPPMQIRISSGAQNLDHTPLIYAIGEHNVAIRGKATLDGQGKHWWNPKDPKQKPHFMYFFYTKNIDLEGFRLQNCPFMNVNPVHSEDITIKGISITNPFSARNTDGINCYSCRNVHISYVSISTGDDCIALDSGQGKVAENIVITESHMRQGHSGVGIGSFVTAGMRNITVSNCVFDGTDRGLYIKSARGRGGVVEDIHYRNVVLQNIKKEGIVLNMVYDPTNHDPAMHNRNIKREPFEQTTPMFRNLQYNGVKGNSKRNPIFFIGLPESPIANIRLDNFDVKSKEHIFLNNTKNIVINGKKQPDYIH